MLCPQKKKKRPGKEAGNEGLSGRAGILEEERAGHVMSSKSPNFILFDCGFCKDCILKAHNLHCLSDFRRAELENEICHF